MVKSKSFSIDISRTKGSGEFKCPKCGTKISPNDQSEDVYTILKPVMKRDRLEKIILQCNKCRSKIHLVGFNVLED
jgi:transcription initiation factor IIE alpha subunit